MEFISFSSVRTHSLCSPVSFANILRQELQSSFLGMIEGTRKVHGEDWKEGTGKLKDSSAIPVPSQVNRDR